MVRINFRTSKYSTEEKYFCDFLNEQTLHKCLLQYLFDDYNDIIVIIKITFSVHLSFTSTFQFY
jgi:hypothetical protein